MAAGGAEHGKTPSWHVAVEEGRFADALVHLEQLASASDSAGCAAALRAGEIIVQHKSACGEASRLERFKRAMEHFQTVVQSASSSPEQAAKACFRMGYMWETGRAPKDGALAKSPKEAAVLYRSARRLCPGPAQDMEGAEARRLLAGILLRQEAGEGPVDFPGALTLSREAAQVQGVPEAGAKAAHLAGSMLESGAEGVPQDWVGAVGCYVAAVRHAQAGAAEGMLEAGQEVGAKAKARLEELSQTAKTRAAFLSSYCKADDVPFGELLDVVDGAMMLVLLRPPEQWHPICKAAMLEKVRVLLMRCVDVDPSALRVSIALQHLDTLCAAKLPGVHTVAKEDIDPGAK